MQIILDIPEVMVANVRGTSVERDMTKLGQEALMHLFKYGFQRVNNDAGAIAKLDGETDEEFDVRAASESVAKADKKWDALVAGTIRVQTGRESDPVKAKAIEIAEAKVEEAYRAANGKAKGKLDKEEAKAIREKAREVVASNPAFMELAKSQVEAAKALDVTISL